jgi:hypothetical protein
MRSALRAGHRQVFGLAGWRTFPIGRGFPAPFWSQCLQYGGRSCLPLRDSSGLTPDSLLDNERRLAQAQGMSSQIYVVVPFEFDEPAYCEG